MHLLVRIEVAIAKDQVTVTRAGGIFRATGDLGKEGISNVAQDQPKGMRAPRNQTTSHTIRAIVQTRCNGSYVLARLVVDAVAVVERPGHCRDVYTRLPRDIFNRHWHDCGKRFPV